MPDPADTAAVLERLERENRALAELVTGADRVDAARVEQLERELARARTDLVKVRYQRDSARHRVAALQARRWWRLGAALAAARRAPGRLLLLPVTVLRILFGPAVTPDVPAPRRPRAAADPRSDTQAPPATRTTNSGGSAQSSAAATPARPHPVVRLQARYLLPPRPRSVAQLRIAAILDTFSFASFAPDVDLVGLRPDTWRSALAADPPHLLLVESAWKGTEGAWEYQVGSYTYPGSVGLPRLRELVGFCRENDIPTVFWNKEDPVHFDKFAEAARLFDVVLTTDADRIPAYRALDGLRAEVVDALPFAAQPRLHRPTHELADRDPRPVFAGTYYRNRHPERREQLEQLLDGARDLDLVIYDRTHGQDNPSVGFPARFHPHITGGVPYEEMVRIYRRHRVFLNTNSVVDSPTMFSRRVFELLACGTPVVSTPSRGVEAMFGDVVPIVRSREEATAQITRLLTDDRVWQHHSAAGLRAILAGHTTQHRLADIARRCGITDLVPYAERQATVLLLDDGAPRTLTLARRLAAALAASGGTGPDATATRGPALAIGTAREDAFSDVEAMTVRQDPAAPAPARWRELADRVHAPMVVLVAATDALDQVPAVTDLLASLPLTTADAVGTDPSGRAWAYVDRVHAAPIALERQLVVEHGWDTAATATEDGARRLAELGIRPYAIGALHAAADTGAG